MQKLENREAITLINQGEKIFGILHRPLHVNQAPVVLICSGFAGNKCGKHRLFVRLSEALASKGIASLRFDYRGAGDSEGSFHDLTIEGNVSDALICLDFLTKDEQINHQRIGLLGRSLGGVISILTAKRYRSIKSLALWAPVFSSHHWEGLWKSYQANQLNSSQHQEILNLPGEIPNLQFLQQFFELKLEEELALLRNIPLLHIHAEHDMLVNREHAEAYRREREALENSRFIHLPYSDHDFSHFADQKLAIEETCQWFQQTL